MRRLFILPTIALIMVAAVTPVLAADKIDVPDYKRWVLSNGLTLIVAENHEVPLVSMRVMVRAGSMDDPEGKEGLADVTATLLRRGAGNYDAKGFAEAVDNVGGTLRTGADVQTSYVTCEFMSKDLKYGLRLLGDLLIHPRFDPGEVEREIRQAVNARRQALDNPSVLANDEMQAQLFAGHPYGHPAAGLAPSLETLTRSELTGFYTHYWTAANSTLAVVGDVNPGDVKKLVEQALGQWNGGRRNPQKVTAPTPVTGRQVVLVVKPDATQTQIRLCQVGIARDNPDYFPVTVANTILGGGFTSWLVDEIRVNRGLSYGANSRFYPYAAGGLFRISTFTKNATTQETIDVALAQIERLRNGELDETTVEKARNYINGLFPLRLETSDDVASALLDLEYYGQSRNWLEDYAKKIADVNVEDVRRVAKEYFPYENLLFVLVGNPDAMRDQVAGYGPLKVVEPGE